MSSMMLTKLAVGIAIVALVVTVHGTWLRYREVTDPNFYPAKMEDYQIGSIIVAYIVWLFIIVYLVGTVAWHLLP